MGVWAKVGGVDDSTGKKAKQVAGLMERRWGMKACLREVMLVMRNAGWRDGGMEGL